MEEGRASAPARETMSTADLDNWGTCQAASQLNLVR